MTVPNLLEWQIAYGETVLDSGQYEVVSFKAFELPPVQTADARRPQRDGSFRGIDRVGSRTINLQMEIWNADFDDLMKVFAPKTPQLLRVNLNGIDTVRILAQVRRRGGTTIDNTTQHGRMSVAVDFWAADPRWFDDVETVEDLTLDHVPHTFSFPLTFPVIFDGGVVRTRNMVNNGSTDAPFSVDIFGYLENPVIENLTTGQSLAITGIIEAGDFLRIDTDAREILYNGTGDRYGFLDDASQWFDLAPGTNELTVRGRNHVAARATFRYRSAWL